MLINELQYLFEGHQGFHFQSRLLPLIITPYKATVGGMCKILDFGFPRSKHISFLVNTSELLTKALKLYALMLLSLNDVFYAWIYKFNFNPSYETEVILRKSSSFVELFGCDKPHLVSGLPQIPEKCIHSSSGSAMIRRGKS